MTREPSTASDRIIWGLRSLVVRFTVIRNPHIVLRRAALRAVAIRVALTTAAQVGLACSDPTPVGPEPTDVPRRAGEPVYVGGSDGGVHVICDCSSTGLSCHVREHPGGSAWTPWRPSDTSSDCRGLESRVYGSSYFDLSTGTFVSSNGGRIAGIWEEPH